MFLIEWRMKAVPVDHSRLAETFPRTNLDLYPMDINDSPLQFKVPEVLVVDLLFCFYLQLVVEAQLEKHCPLLSFLIKRWCSRGHGHLCRRLWPRDQGEILGLSCCPNTEIVPGFLTVSISTIVWRHPMHMEPFLLEVSFLPTLFEAALFSLPFRNKTITVVGIERKLEMTVCLEKTRKEFYSLSGSWNHLWQNGPETWVLTKSPTLNHFHTGSLGGLFLGRLLL